MLKNCGILSSCIEKALNISFYIVYNSERRMSTQKTIARLGPKEVEVLTFLEAQGGQAWKEQIMAKFSWAAKYQNILLRRLYRLQEKGLIKIGVEINPETGRQKQKVYLIK